MSAWSLQTALVLGLVDHFMDQEPRDDLALGLFDRVAGPVEGWVRSKPLIEDDGVMPGEIDRESVDTFLAGQGKVADVGYRLELVLEEVLIQLAPQHEKSRIHGNLQRE